MTKLTWTLPTLFSVILIELSVILGFSLPVPFFIIVACVIIAGSFGGQLPGFIAGLMASALVVRSYFVQFGPSTLTGDVPQVVVGSMLFLVIGISLGRLKDLRDSSLQSLREIERKLKSSLLDETAESARQTNKVAESEARLETAIRIAGIGHFSFEADSGNCTYCSLQHAAHFGITPEEFIARSSGSNLQLPLIHSEDHAMFRDAIHKLDSGEIQNFEYRVVRPNGEIRYLRQVEEPVFDHNGRMIQSVGTSLDLTDLRLAEDRLRQSQRIEAIGKLTGGVAHDFNNLLAIVLGNLELSLTVDSDEEREELTRSAIKASLRGADLTKSLLSFSRRANLQPKRLDLNKLVENTMTWSARVLPTNIDIEESFMAGLWEVELDQTSAETAVINIMLNGRDAMPDGGKIRIETSNVAIDGERLAGRNEDIEPGRYAMLAISDTGHGIPSDKLEAVFEPFFTDKPFGQGSGLGLSMVQGFIKQSGGAIRVSSEVGVGTTFKLYFRAAENEAIRPRIESREPRQTEIGQGSILIAEDEAEVTKVLRRTLEGAGYIVETAINGDEALEIFKSSRHFDLLITDVMMPGRLLGPALAKAIRLIAPNLPCLFLSGYATKPTVIDSEPGPSDIHLMKPVGRADLLFAVSKAINSGK